MPSNMMTVRRAAEVLGVTAQAIHYLLRQGQLNGHQLRYGNRWVIDSTSVYNLRDEKEILQEADESD